MRKNDSQIAECFRTIKDIDDKCKEKLDLILSKETLTILMRIKHYDNITIENYVDIINNGDGFLLTSPILLRREIERNPTGWVKFSKYLRTNH